MVQLEHARGLQAHSVSVSSVRWGSGWRWGCVRQVEVKATDLLLLFDAVAVHVLTCRKFTDVWSIETWSSELVFAKCKPDPTYRVLSYGTVVYASVLRADPPSPEAPIHSVSA